MTIPAFDEVKLNIDDENNAKQSSQCTAHVLRDCVYNASELRFHRCLKLVNEDSGRSASLTLRDVRSITDEIDDQTSWACARVAGCWFASG